MSRILVIGSYGGFGARLSRRLADAGHIVLVAGRSAEKAARFAAGLAGAEPFALDRDGDVGAALARLRPDLVVDAAGPFQTSGYAVPGACIAAGLPYLDLADARGFVAGIGALDEAARAAGVAVVTGASTLPALTGALARRLAEGLDRVACVEVALSVASRGSAGASVVRAILSYVGRPVPLWRGRRRTHGFGWQEMRREDFLFADGSGLSGRLVALADVPDTILLPDLLPGRPAVALRAGTEFALPMRALWLASWPVRRGRPGSLLPAARPLAALHRLLLPFDGGRSAMKMVLRGEAGGRRVERRWTLVAERGEGIEVPTLAAELLAADLLAGRLAPGARDSARLLDFGRFEAAFAGLALRHETVEREIPPPLYARLLGPAFAALPESVRALHDFVGDAGAAGRGRVERGRGLFARMLARAMHMPPPGSTPLHVAFAERDGIERWTRDFGGHVFASELKESRGRLVERFGALHFLFDLPAGPDGLAMRLCGWSAFGVPLPRALAPRIAARESQEAGRFRFDVEVSFPWGGRIVRYSGWLVPLRGEDPAADQGFPAVENAAAPPAIAVNPA